MSKVTHNLWTTGEARLLARLYPSSMPAAALYAAFPRHPRRSVQAYARRVLKVSRPNSCKPPRATPAWDQMREILEHEALTAGELVARCGVSQQRVSELLANHRGEIYVVDWRPPHGRGHWRAVWAYGDQPDAERPFQRNTAAAREERAARRRSPFLVAAGLVQAPAGEPGRRFQQPMTADDEVPA